MIRIWFIDAYPPTEGTFDFHIVCRKSGNILPPRDLVYKNPLQPIADSLLGRNPCNPVYQCFPSHIVCKNACSSTSCNSGCCGTRQCQPTKGSFHVHPYNLYLLQIFTKFERYCSAIFIFTFRLFVVYLLQRSCTVCMKPCNSRACILGCFCTRQS